MKRILLWGLLLSFWANAQAATVTVSLSGLEPRLEQNVRVYLGLLRQGKNQSLGPRLIRRLFERAPEEIRQALQPFGYYRVEIQADLLEPEDPDGTWQAQFAIQPGKPVLLETLDIRLNGPGAEDAALRALLEASSLRLQHPLQHMDYEKLKQDLRTLAAERGYFSAEFSRHEILIDESAYTAALYLHFETGQRACLNRLDFDQLYFSDGFLDHFRHFEPGAPYTSDTLLKLRNDLINSDYFSDVELTTEEAEEEGREHCLNVEAHVSPRRVNKYLGRIGYGTDTGARLGGEWTRRYLNSHGHRVITQIEAAQNKRRLVTNIDYIIPTGQINRDNVIFRLRYKGETIEFEDVGFPPDEQGGSTTITDASLSVRKQHFRNLFGLRLREEISLNYLIESYSILDLLESPGLSKAEITAYLQQTGQAQELEVLEPDYRVLYPEISWTYQHTDNPAYTRAGYEISLHLRAASASLGSTLTFSQAELRSQFIRAFGAHGRLLLRGNFAYTTAQTVDTFGLQASLLPRELQFRTGGDRTVRGYRFQQLKGDDTLVSGKHYLVGSAEYEYPIYKDWSVAGFFDVGNAFNQYSDMSLKRGVGLGLRWRSPVGLVRADFAWGMDNEESPWRFHLVIGPDFYLF